MHGQQQQQQQQQQQSAVGTSSSEYSTAAAEQLIRKWSTKSNSSNAGDQLRTLREQLGITGAKGGAGYAMAKGRSSSSSYGGGSRPQLPFLAQQSDSAIGSSAAPSLGGSFSSFLPPPPPYRPRQHAASAGSDGAIGQHHQQQQQQDSRVPRGTDFTSLLGFDLVRAEATETGQQQQQQRRDGSEEETAPQIQQQQQQKQKSGKQIRQQQREVAADKSAISSGGRRRRTEPIGQITGYWSSQRSTESPSPSAMSCSGAVDFPDMQERVQQLQVSRDSLSMQVAVLSQQVSLQRDKIRDLETMLEARRSANGHQQQQQLEAIPAAAQQEMAEMQHKYLALEREKLEAERRLRLSNSELERLSEQPQLQQPPHQQNGGSGGGQTELERLQLAIQRLLADNEHKDSMIQSLRVSLEEERRRLANGSWDEAATTSFSPQPLDINEQIRRILLLEEDDGLGQQQQQQQMMAHSSSYPLALSQGQQRVQPSGLPPAPPMRQAHHHLAGGIGMPVSSSYSSALAQQQQQQQQHAFAQPPPLWRVASPPAIPPHMSQSRTAAASPMARQLAAELDELRRSGSICPGSNGDGNGVLILPYSSASLPRSIHSKSNSLGSAPSQPGKRTAAFSQFESDDETGSHLSSSIAANHQPTGGGDKQQFKRGRRARSTLRSFLGRFAHRGNSLQDLRPSPRPSPSPASAAGAGPICLQPPVRQFVDWDGGRCARWLTELGFEGCQPGTVRSGRHLLNMSDTEMERELGLHSALQRKRLRCRLARIERGTEFEPADRLDTNQVMCWLDLIGLPQHRDLFAECRMDGQLLLALSAQDLLELGIHSALNHASLARGIQFLRSVEFHLHRLERHFHPDSLTKAPVPTEVERWSHGCTLEWLCSVDLAEFTPNLAFSGMHGALIVLEPTFTAESLAEMLQIPAHRTLIRRHLSSQFNALLGQQVISHKREVLTQPFVTHLMPSLRIRLAKKGFSLARKKSRSDIFVEPEVRVCPAQANGEEMSDV